MVARERKTDCEVIGGTDACSNTYFIVKYTSMMAGMTGETPFAFEFAPDGVRVETMPYYGPPSRVVDQLANGGLDGTLDQGRAFWAPARLVRAVLDGPLDDPQKVPLVEAVTTFAIDAYAGTATDPQLAVVARRLEEHGLWRRNIEQTYDQTTITAIAPELSQQTAHRLEELAPGRRLLIPVCHGGLVAAVQTYLYARRAGAQDTAVYPVRHSRVKHFDRQPRVTTHELAYLTELAVGATVVVHDEDAWGGTSMRKTVAYMRERLEAPVVGVVNSDHRSPRRRIRQGENW
jgi:hypothetical protein